jgi:hypothetical protein
MKDRSTTPSEVGYKPDWETVMPKYRERWKERNGRKWEDVEPAYRVGWEVARRTSRERGWSEIEPEFRRTWTERYPDKPWDRVLDAAEDVWDDLTAEPGDSPHADEVGAQDESSGR